VAALAYGLASLLHVNNKTYIHENDYAVVEEEIKQIYMEQFTLLCFMEIKITTSTSHPWNERRSMHREALTSSVAHAC
jgi:hypothetical protein